MIQAEELLREGRLPEALADLQNRIRQDPASVHLRVFLFQLLCVLGVAKPCGPPCSPDNGCPSFSEIRSNGSPG